MITRRKALKALLSALWVGAFGPRERRDGGLLRVEDMASSDYLKSSHFGQVRGNTCLGTVVEGPALDLGGTRFGYLVPRPRLVWGLAEEFSRQHEDVLAFLGEALPLAESASWRVQRSRTYRTLVRWFFEGCRGPAWISTIPLKPRSDHVLALQGATTKAHPPKYELIAKQRGVYLGSDLPDLHPCPSLFAYDTPGRQKRTVFLHQVKREELTMPASRSRPRGGFHRWYDHSLFLVEPGADDDFLPQSVSMRRSFYDDTLKLYTCPHIWFCKVIDDSPPQVLQLAIGLHPSDGKPFGLKVAERPLGALMQQQILDGLMLRAAGVAQ